jgi:hypothetical protein
MSLAADWDALYCQGRLLTAGQIEWDDPEKRTVGAHGTYQSRCEQIRSTETAGIGAHRIEAIKTCVDYGLKPDFWVKTCHSYNYWSAQTSTEWR